MRTPRVFDLFLLYFRLHLPAMQYNTYTEVQNPLSTELMKIIVLESNQPNTWEWIRRCISDIRQDLHTDLTDSAITEVLLLARLDYTSATQVHQVREWNNRNPLSIIRSILYDAISDLLTYLIKYQRMWKVSPPCEYHLNNSNRSVFDNYK
jgi:hypothetical protein